MPTLPSLGEFEQVVMLAILRLGTDAYNRQLSQRRADNMRLFAADLRGTGELRSDLTDDQVADLIWSTNAPEYYELLVSRGLDAEQIERLLTDLWTRVLLSD